MSYQEEEFITKKLSVSIWSKIISLLTNHKKELYLLFFFMILVAVCDVAFPLLNRYALEQFVDKGFELSSLFTFVLVYGGFILSQCVFIFQFFYWAGRVELRFSKLVRMKAFKKLQELSFSYFDKTANGWILARMGNDIGKLAEIISWGLMDMIWGFALMLFVSIVMLVVNWKLALIVLTVVPIMAFLSVWFQDKIHEKQREIRRQNSLITAAYAEGITGAKTSKTLVLEEKNIEDFNKLTHTLKEKSIKSAWYSALFVPLIVGLGSFASGALLWSGGSMAINSIIEVGTLVLFVQYATQFFDPLRQISHLLSSMQMAQTSAERVLSLLASEPTVVDSDEVIKKYGTIWEPRYENYEPIVGDIEFKNVSFHYNENQPILKDFNLKVKSGDMVALVGETGGGKSTIVNLLCRFYEPIDGEILIDGVDYRKRSIGWLHNSLGYVLQTPYLFDETIIDNVRYGNKDISEETVIKCCQIVNADSFIQELDHGYSTRVGEGGNKLSSGQKQLISFARALCCDPRILILDEATSSVDSENEEIIQKAIAKVMENRTSFVVAHRLSTIVNADKIIVVDNGLIIEEGTFNQLMDLKGRFYDLYLTQTYQEEEKTLLNS